MAKFKSVYLPVSQIGILGSALHSSFSADPTTIMAKALRKTIADVMT